MTKTLRLSYLCIEYVLIDIFIFQDDCNTDNDINLSTNGSLDKHSESNGSTPNVSTVVATCDDENIVGSESHVVVGQQPPEDLMQNVECELEEPEGEILLVK